MPRQLHDYTHSEGSYSREAYWKLKNAIFAKLGKFDL